MKKKNKDEYNRIKRLKQLAKQKEKNHKIEYSSIKDKDYRCNRSYNYGGAFEEIVLMSAIIRAKRKNHMWANPNRKIIVD
jgi:CRISPR/Cas system CMR-associated protein Cmr3 (group 5 of RAMP superfamily)